MNSGINKNAYCAKMKLFCQQLCCLNKPPGLAVVFHMGDEMGLIVNRCFSFQLTDLGFFLST